MEEWHALQEWLAGSEHRVVVPYANVLAESIPTVAVRLRRDFRMILSFIMAHAILHQATRQRDSNGKIIATMADYATVRDLVSDLVAEGLDATVSPETRETVSAVDKMCQTGADSVSISQLAKYMKLHKGTVSRRVDVCIENGYLRNEETKKGKPSMLKVGDQLPEDQEILPHPDRLYALASIPVNSEECCTVAALPLEIEVAPLSSENEAPNELEDNTVTPPEREQHPARDWLAFEAEIAKGYESKATLPNGVPPYQRVLAQQDWLTSIDWRYGLRCGRTGQQCLTCNGMPCHESTAWQPRRIA